MKKVLMIIGSNCSGKTTQSKLIHQNLNGGGLKEIRKIEFIGQDGEDDFTYITMYDRTSHVGKVEDNQCTGTDSLSRKLQIEFSYLSLIMSDTQLIVIDGIMATSVWSELIHQVRPSIDIQTILVLLNYSTPEANYARLKQRRANKTGEPVSSIILSEKTQDNVYSKLRGFKSMYEKIKHDFNVYAEMDADLSKEQIFERVQQLIDL